MEVKIKTFLKVSQNLLYKGLYVRFHWITRLGVFQVSLGWTFLSVNDALPHGASLMYKWMLYISRSLAAFPPFPPSLPVQYSKMESKPLKSAIICLYRNTRRPRRAITTACESMTVSPSEMRNVDLAVLKKKREKR